MSALLEDIYALLDSNQPFVAFNGPESKVVKLIHQDNDELFTTQTLATSGFVFAPFDTAKDVVILPDTHSKEYEYLPANTIEGQQTYKGSGREFHEKLVAKGIEAIRKGMMEKVVLSRKQLIKTGKHPVDIFQYLLDSYPKAFVYIFHHPKVGLWLGATPEVLVHTTDNDFETMSLAGTIHLEDTQDVVWRNKELEEQLIVTEAIVKELKDIANVKVGKLQTVRAGNLLHLKTVIKGTFLQTLDLKDLVYRLHPTPAVCGLPTQAAKDFILRCEGYDREYYTGFLGEINPKGKSALFVNLRCMKYGKGTAALYIGGGITKDSDPEAEWVETVNKSMTMMRAL